MPSISVSNARATLPELLDLVLAGEEVTITRHGRPVAVLVRPDVLAVRRADNALGQAERLRELIESAHAVPLEDAPSISTSRAGELAAEVAGDRGPR
ncbi:MAG: type II toxin-antitoxin system Phd/YefM family antitoxin [Microthrixaceae bacterium]|jgi:antitoxin (DNA-binding transcriptional repressor) of toxin-antitoxin stability system